MCHGCVFIKVSCILVALLLHKYVVEFIVTGNIVSDIDCTLFKLIYYSIYYLPKVPLQSPMPRGKENIRTIFILSNPIKTDLFLSNTAPVM